MTVTTDLPAISDEAVTVVARMLFDDTHTPPRGTTDRAPTRQELDDHWGSLPDFGRRHYLDRARRYLTTAQPQIVADAVREHLCLPLLAARRCIPDGEIRSGCHVHDGRQVRERVRAGYLALTRIEPAPADAPQPAPAPHRHHEPEETR